MFDEVICAESTFHHFVFTVRRRVVLARRKVRWNPRTQKPNPHLTNWKKKRIFCWLEQLHKILYEQFNPRTIKLRKSLRNTCSTDLWFTVYRWIWKCLARKWLSENIFSSLTNRFSFRTPKHPPLIWREKKRNTKRVFHPHEVSRVSWYYYTTLFRNSLNIV